MSDDESIDSSNQQTPSGGFNRRPGFNNYLNLRDTNRLRHTSTQTSLRTSAHSSTYNLEPSKYNEELRRSNIIATLPVEVQQTGNLLGHLQIRPGESGFLLWYSISNSFPIIAASLGPISNLNSIAALVDPWRINTSDNSRPTDFKWILALNAISLFFGCVSNISLFLNFSGRVNYIYAQMISIIGWYFAWGLLVTLLVSAKFVYFNDPVMTASEGYWHAIFTAMLYFVSATMLLMNWIGHRKGRYSASFNLTSSQRRIMLQNVLLIVWIGLGGLLFSYLNNLRYTDTVYYCVVTVTTIGLGDIVPHTNVSRALILPFALVGVIYLGLIVTTISSVVLTSNGEAMVFDRSERSRTQVYEQLIQQQQEENPIPPKESFLLIHKIHRRARRRRKLTTLYSSLIAFSMFWLLGALIFHLSEPGWSYFDGLYFASLCLLTIGYGDYDPTSSAGRAFFIIWALGAVPMMTMLISNLSDNLFQWINDVGDIATAWLLAAYSVRIQYYTFWKLRFRRMAEFLNWNVKKDLDKEDKQVAEIKSDELEDALDAETDPDDEYVFDDDDSATRDEECGSGISHSESEPSRNKNKNKRIAPPLGQVRARKTATAEIENVANRVLRIVQEVRSLATTAVHEPEKAFTYEDWQRISQIVAGGDLDEISSDFWLSEKSPVRFPLPEVRFFLQECLEGIEVGIFDMVNLIAESEEEDAKKKTLIPEQDMVEVANEKEEDENKDEDEDKQGPQLTRNSSLQWDLPKREPK